MNRITVKFLLEHGTFMTVTKTFEDEAEARLTLAQMVCTEALRNVIVSCSEDMRVEFANGTTFKLDILP